MAVVKNDCRGSEDLLVDKENNDVSAIFNENDRFSESNRRKFLLEMIETWNKLQYHDAGILLHCLKATGTFDFEENKFFIENAYPGNDSNDILFHKKLISKYLIEVNDTEWLAPKFCLKNEDKLCKQIVLNSLGQIIQQVCDAYNLFFNNLTPKELTMLKMYMSDSETLKNDLRGLIKEIMKTNIVIKSTINNMLNFSAMNPFGDCLEEVVGLIKEAQTLFPGRKYVPSNQVGDSWKDSDPPIKDMITDWRGLIDISSVKNLLEFVSTSIAIPKTNVLQNNQILDEAKLSMSR